MRKIEVPVPDRCSRECPLVIDYYHRFFRNKEYVFIKCILVSHKFRRVGIRPVKACHDAEIGRE
jgi:hypothetical protein